MRGEKVPFEFRIEWGFRMVYARRMYHDVFDWSGELKSSDPGAEFKICSLHYPPCMWGMVYEPDAEKEEPSHCFHSVLRRDAGGIRVCGECAPDAEFFLENRYGTFRFSLPELAERGRIVFPVGPKYGFYSIIVTRKDFEYFVLPPRENEIRSDPADWKLPEKITLRRAKMYTLAPGGVLRLALDVPPRRKSPESKMEILCHFTGMPLLDMTSEQPPPEPEKPERRMDYYHAGTPGVPEDVCSAVMRFELGFEGEERYEVRHYFRFHDFEIQLREDVWRRIPAEPGKKIFTLKNLDPYFPFHLSTLAWEVEERTDLELQLPRWARTGEKVFGRFFLFEDREIAVVHGPEGKTFSLAGKAGWNELAIVPYGEGIKDYPVVLSDAGGRRAAGAISYTYAVSGEAFPLMVGADLTTVPHDDSGELDHLLDHMARTRLGNTVLFRSFHPFPMSEFQPPDACLERWGRFCRNHAIYVQSVNCHRSGALARGAGEYLHNSGFHEYSGLVYAVDPKPGDEGASSMDEAERRFIEFIHADAVKDPGVRGRVGYGEASGAARYMFKAGAQFLRAETMVGHTNMLCASVRGASEVFGRGDWGVHIAIQHAFQPYDTEKHLSLYFLSLALPWAMGCSDLYEEDSLFLAFKEKLQCWRDAIPKLKRDMTRDFFRFASLHPRSGRPENRIGVLEGRHQAPFNGFICGPEQTPAYSVWGGCGSEDPAWGHLQPEKGRHLLDVLAPGAAALPLMQDPSKRRFFFSGTPYGDFDFIPVEAEESYFDRVKLLFNLNWHSSNPGDLAKIKGFVRRGGTYFAGLPEYSRHKKRDFLRDMDDLDLENGGDLREFCGLRVLGRSKIAFSGRTVPELPTPEMSRRYSFSAGEDGECFFAELELQPDTEVVLRDAANGRVLAVRRRYGKGTVYTLCAWAYPGHEKLSRAMAGLIAALCREHCGEIRLQERDPEIFYNVRRDKFGQTVMLLNTDWTRKGNVRECTLLAGKTAVPVRVTEGKISIVKLLGDNVLLHDRAWHIEAVSPDEIVIHGDSDGTLVICSPGGLTEKKIEFSGRTAAKMKL